MATATRRSCGWCITCLRRSSRRASRASRCRCCRRSATAARRGSFAGPTRARSLVQTATAAPASSRRIGATSPESSRRIPSIQAGRGSGAATRTTSPCAAPVRAWVGRTGAMMWHPSSPPTVRWWPFLRMCRPPSASPRSSRRASQFTSWAATAWCGRRTRPSSRSTRRSGPRCGTTSPWAMALVPAAKAWQSSGMTHSTTTWATGGWTTAWSRSCTSSPEPSGRPTSRGPWCR
mmetsp:Transcript_93138/g.221565  ORF Transcript_93138/g.221565 Transcript_93138/m.221565 type:complete len:234 (-) Transcript_93138:783-1484(-)